MAEQPITVETEPVIVETTPESVQPTVDWEQDDNPYKKRYMDSQGQITPLVGKLHEFAEYDHNTKTWKPKSLSTPTPKKEDDFEETLKGYDPEFVKAFSGYSRKQAMEVFGEQNKRQEESAKYVSETTASRNKSMEEFGDEFDFVKGGKINPSSPLYKVANVIFANKYVQLNPDGTLHKWTNTDGEYLAVAEAYALLSKQAKQQNSDKWKLAAIQGKGSKASGVKKNLTYEEYSKLSSDEKDAHDLAQTGG